MKGLRKIIYPFAPDQSGVVSVLYELGGIVVICDAGGCTGNICGFDEPRWFEMKSAIFSAGLRDMDAILGRDDMMTKKIVDVCQKMDATFIALVGTVVPATIGTDLKAIAKLLEKDTNIKVLSFDSNGVRLYDDGVSKAYLSLIKKFADDSLSKKENLIGVLGASPLDMISKNEYKHIKNRLKSKEENDYLIYGMSENDNPLYEIKNALSVQKNIVISPSGLDAAKYMKKQYDIEYECRYPLSKLEEVIDIKENDLGDKKILIIHQQILANEIRKKIRIINTKESDITVATWFMLSDDIKEEGDIHLLYEDQFIELIDTKKYDVIIADKTFKKAIKDYKGLYIEIPHFAVSGEWW